MKQNVAQFKKNKQQMTIVSKDLGGKNYQHQYKSFVRCSKNIIL